MYQARVYIFLAWKNAPPPFESRAFLFLRPFFLIAVCKLKMANCSVNQSILSDTDGPSDSYFNGPDLLFFSL